MVEILRQRGCRWIHGEVWIGHGIHESIGAPFEQSHEGVPEWVPFGSGKQGMFDDMGNSAIVERWGLE
jgi:hypothetical protein